jgi:uncharacterized protein YbaR (Trm112 family)
MSLSADFLEIVRCPACKERVELKARWQRLEMVSLAIASIPFVTTFRSC